MKIKLEPPLAYLIGAWKWTRTKEGIGVRGTQMFVEEFVTRAIQAKLVEAEKIQLGEGRAYFYHTAYRLFFQNTLKREDEAFCHANDYAAAFLAGLFDAVGSVEDGQVVLSCADKRDEMVLLRLGYRVTWKEKRAYIVPSDQFLKFIKGWRA
ncbi:MAG: LAGLIDADG family homing endonuclease, partial [Candidatus Micrarchaeota archaeon]